MLLNVTHDRVFQKFLDEQEQTLHVKMRPLLMTGARMALRKGTVPAQHYINQRGEKVLLAHYRRIFRAVYKSVSDKVQKARNPDAEGSNAFMNKVNEYLGREAANRIADIGLSLVEDIRDKLVSGMNEGWAINAITADIFKAIPDMTQNRGATIARTETHGASMWAMDETFKEKEIEIQKKQWWSSQDNRVRESHRSMHGMIVDYDQPFETDDGDMMFPGDDSLGADAGGLINCRCACLYFSEGSIPSEDSSTSDEFE